MDTQEVKVTDKDGNMIPALMATCPDCGNSSFRILIINGHNHLECLNCGNSFCQGGNCGAH